MMKRAAKFIIVRILGWQVKQLLRKNSVKVIGVVGSIGKTSTKFAISAILKQKYQVRTQEGNYNDAVTVPLVFFGHDNPSSLMNPVSWIKILLNNQKQLRQNYPFEVVIVELATDGIGQIAAFGNFLKLDIAVLTAISPEHMEFFTDLDTVAYEETMVKNYSNKILANRDLCGDYINDLPNLQTYGKESGDYHFAALKLNETSYGFDVMHDNEKLLSSLYKGISELGLYSVLAGIAVAENMDMSQEDIHKGIAAMRPIPGRLQPLKGIKGSVILDDSYNASPEAVKAALQTVYNFPASQKIVLLGNMNELGDYSAAAHSEIGELCDPKELDWVVTLGPDANAFTALAAQQKGCQVKTCVSPYEAGSFIADQLRDRALILIKGSQNGVFAEEAIKPLLADPTDQQKLVRQSKEWMVKKKKQFNTINEIIK